MKNETIKILNIALDMADSDLVNDYIFEEIMEILIKLDDDLDTSPDIHLELSAGDVRIIDKNAIDEIWTESLIEQIQDCYDLDNVPSFIEIDWQETAENCKVDGLGHHFASYDGHEEDTENFYIFRTN